MASRCAEFYHHASYAAVFGRYVGSVEEDNPNWWFLMTKANYQASLEASVEALEAAILFASDYDTREVRRV